ncbi:tRNA (adenosine(37)-N6)-threonylcarbamoyltransferase complex dimerization subunit type 1 TsaB [Rhodococcus sp. D2-41]|uniref:tRNA (Adenosine(37)-N6)-threonylcarbamoyltransferase complex dimerization subunit type 1 TsaB n=1 Tax=Speluncibacter jeojiensis TaxID=2710754 RepID=A0A9X4M4A6_9ACTN|nr:tRNA (adenosine(37)-N6)-threonylcarbamoyltransferase complex dimerization subunit type 1 TsaB [Rhodococcus sp. D2-41]MDG3008937.1 tRNA (adenosine(37)-N6)-threonylcarbamoyltransferase complex dimerization subunit type 1 TsaB [Rhodococcus sp. D2-41]MDG3016559.1 tRNA (adenosine(37)-N6)-threonylcarbamoyltransferase complex dimerization subunit type 1 TsaB [Corynebacteriales bacterium D3-21]
MLVLAIDTSTPAVTAGVVRLSRHSADTLATRVTHNARAHAEVLTPQVLEALAECGHALDDLDAVVVGVGPGPYTGLRVGMATAAAFADALGIPVHGVCSLDAIAAEAHAEGDVPGNLLVVTDARRREVYWARYEGGRRVAGPAVLAPAELPASPSVAVAGSAAHAELFDLPPVPVHSPTPAGLVSVAAESLLAGAVPAPLMPLYLRRPDAVEPKPRAVRAAQSPATQAGAGSGS